MKVKEYLVNRILKLEEELKHTRNEKEGTTYGLQKLQEEVIKLNEKIDQYQREREEIKQLIICNIKRYNSGVHYLELDEYVTDYKTLLAILDIQPGDYEMEESKPEYEHISAPPNCWGCKYEEITGNDDPCTYCSQGDKFEEMEVTPDAKTKD